MLPASLLTLFVVSIIGSNVESDRSRNAAPFIWPSHAVVNAADDDQHEGEDSAVAQSLRKEGWGATGAHDSEGASEENAADDFSSASEQPGVLRGHVEGQPGDDNESVDRDRSGYRKTQPSAAARYFQNEAVANRDKSRPVVERWGDADHETLLKPIGNRKSCKRVMVSRAHGRITKGAKKMNVRTTGVLSPMWTSSGVHLSDAGDTTPREWTEPFPELDLSRIAETAVLREAKANTRFMFSLEVGQGDTGPCTTCQEGQVYLPVVVTFVEDDEPNRIVFYPTKVWAALSSTTDSTYWIPASLASIPDDNNQGDAYVLPKKALQNRVFLPRSYLKAGYSAMPKAQSDANQYEDAGDSINNFLWPGQRVTLVCAAPGQPVRIVPTLEAVPRSFALPLPVLVDDVFFMSEQTKAKSPPRILLSLTVRPCKRLVTTPLLQQRLEPSEEVTVEETPNRNGLVSLSIRQNRKDVEVPESRDDMGRRCTSSRFLIVEAIGAAMLRSLNHLKATLAQIEKRLTSDTRRILSEVPPGLREGGKPGHRGTRLGVQLVCPSLEQFLILLSTLNSRRNNVDTARPPHADVIRTGCCQVCRMQGVTGGDRKLASVQDVSHYRSLGQKEAAFRTTPSSCASRHCERWECALIEQYGEVMELFREKDAADRNYSAFGSRRNKELAVSVSGVLAGALATYAGLRGVARMPAEAEDLIRRARNTENIDLADIEKYFPSERELANAGGHQNIPAMGQGDEFTRNMRKHAYLANAGFALAALSAVASIALITVKLGRGAWQFLRNRRRLSKIKKEFDRFASSGSGEQRFKRYLGVIDGECATTSITYLQFVY
uniref:Transmembrane protein n=1 Tax=Neospora caninum (strain Liverpool) TaxID=572307 RepID=A0A0F7UD16_NEOCL|nr:TPA: hypothetical protein BN1204_020905 [Neospora caninum Liverpool]